jgi:hypothetical protein
VKGEVPPVNDEVVVNVALWPGSMTAGLAEMTGGLRGLFSVTITAVELTFSAGEPLSRVCSSKDQSPVMERTPVETVGLVPRLQRNETPRSEYSELDGDFSSHWQE